jgi:hypothetical protein
MEWLVLLGNVARDMCLTNMQLSRVVLLSATMTRMTAMIMQTMTVRMMVPTGLRGRECVLVPTVLHMLQDDAECFKYVSNACCLKHSTLLKVFQNLPETCQRFPDLGAYPSQAGAGPPGSPPGAIAISSKIGLWGAAGSFRARSNLRTDPVGNYRLPGSSVDAHRDRHSR